MAGTHKYRQKQDKAKFLYSHIGQEVTVAGVSVR